MLYKLEDEGDKADRAAAFINREIDGDVSSSAAGSRGKKREREGESWQCARRIDDEQHVDPFTHMEPESVTQERR